jgi:hypothetical protein
MTESGRRPVYLHVGAPKSGTTFLQGMLWTNRNRLRKDGFLYPGDRWESHVWATLDLRKVKFKGYSDPNTVNAWSKMVAEIREFDGPAIIDQELLSGAFPHQIGRVKQDLSFADLHIVYTLRDMARTIPAAWQEWVKNRETDSFAEFIAEIQRPPEERSRAGKLFWNLHSADWILEKWARNLAPENIHVITIPRPGADHDILWNRFAQVLGLDPSRYAEDRNVNTSLSAAQATTVRRVNIAIGGDNFPWAVYDRVIKNHVTPELSRHRRGASIALPPDAFEWAAEWSRQTAKVIADRGYDVVGDLDELIPAPSRGGVDPDAAPAEDQAATAIDGMATLISYIARGGDDELNPLRLSDLETRVDRAERKVTEHEQLRPAERIKRCVVELAAQVGWLNRIYRVYRKVLRRPAVELTTSL